MRDQPMPALTALQQLQLKQLQEQHHSLQEAAQQQQAAAMLAQQQQAAQRLHVLNQQRGLLAAGGIGAAGGLSGMRF
jgi:DNA-binding protein H-NS